MFDEMMMRFEAMSRDIKVQFDAMREDVRENRDRLNGIEHFVTQVPRSSCHAHMARDSIPQYPSRDSSAPQPMPHISSPVLVMPQSGITLFKAEVPASQPLQRSQELEAWIKQIENVTQPSTGEAMCQMARVMCRGTAEVIINSSVFDGITDWVVFKGKLKEHFRGIGSPHDYFTLLYQQRMMPDQSPFDFYLNLQAAVLQGERDYPNAIGDPDILARRVFLQGVPQWMRGSSNTR